MGGPGSGGHNKKSVNQHIIDGTYRKDRHSGIPLNGHPVAKLDSLKPPRWLFKDAKAFWREYAPLCDEIGTLDVLSLRLFECLCCVWADVRETGRTLKEEGSIVEVKGELKSHPCVGLHRKAVRDFLSLAGEFGLTPMGRKRLGIEFPTGDKDNRQDDPIEWMLREAGL